MNIWEAIKELQEGKRIRQNHYVKGVYLYMDDDGYIRFNNGEKYRFMSGVNLNDDEWEIYEELGKEETKYERKEVEERVKCLFNIICDMNSRWTQYDDFIESGKCNFDEKNYIEIFFQQLSEMNRYYKLDI